MNRISRSGSTFWGVAHLFSIDTEPWLYVLSYCMCLSASFPCSFHLLLCPSIVLWTHVSVSEPFFLLHFCRKAGWGQRERKNLEISILFSYKNKAFEWGFGVSTEHTQIAYSQHRGDFITPMGDKSGLPLDRAKAAAGVSAVMVLGEKG